MVRANSNTSFVPFKPGDRIRVLYLKDHPESARINTIPQLWMPQLILGVFGAAFTMVAVRIQMRKRPPGRARLLS